MFSITDVIGMDLPVDVYKSIIMELSNFTDTVKAVYPNEYTNLALRIENLAYGNHFNADRLATALSIMKNLDGTIGGYWTLDQTNAAATSYSLDFNKTNFNQYDFNYVMNMLYSNYSDLIKDIPTFFSFALDFLNDANSKEGKAYLYYLNLIGNT